MKINIKKDRMTKDERWAALLSRQPLDRVPVFGFAMGFATVHQGLSISDAYNKPEKMFDALTKTAAEFGWQDLPWIGYASFGAWEFGGEIKWPSGEFAQAPTPARLPVQIEEDVDKLNVPDVKTAGIIPLMMKVSKLQEKKSSGLIFLGAIPSAWDLACNIVGVDKLCKWALKKPDLVERLEQKIHPFSIAMLRYWVDVFGVDRLLPWVGSGTLANNALISPKTFEKLVLPEQKQLFNEAHAMGIKHFFIHICGEHNANLPYWAQLNYGDPGVLSFGHEIDLETAGKYFPNDIIVGNLEPAIIQTGTPEEVYSAARVVIEKGRKLHGGFMFAPGCELPPMSPPDNILAMMQAVSDFGWYE